MTDIRNNITDATPTTVPTPDSPIIKPLVGSPLGKAQVALELLGELPAGFVVPSVGEMANGDEVCDHSCDVEHAQEVDGRRFVTSVVWTTDGGVGTFPRETIIGCQWIATVQEEVEAVRIFDTGWEEVVEVILDCDADAPEDIAIAEAMKALTDAINGTF